MVMYITNVSTNLSVSNTCPNVNYIGFGHTKTSQHLTDPLILRCDLQVSARVHNREESI